MQVASNNSQKSKPNSSQLGATVSVAKTSPIVKQKSSQKEKKEKKAGFFSIFKKKELSSAPAKIKSPVSKKQIPTILGLLILLISLGVGVLLFGQGTGVFAPRATAQTTPKNIRISNVTDKSFTISFYTDEETIAFLKYAEAGEKLTEQASDDRDQLSGIVKAYKLHHLTVRGLDAASQYDYILGTGSDTFDNEGVNYRIITAGKPGSSPKNNQTIYGVINGIDGQPAEGAVVYIYHQQMGTLSTLVKSSGSWGLSLSNAFSTDKSDYADLTDETELQFKIQGIKPTLITNWKTEVGDAQPVQELILGQENIAVEVETKTETDYINKEELLADDKSSTESGALGSLIAAETEVLDLSLIEEDLEASATTVSSSKPIIKAVLPANTTVRIIINSDTQIDQTLQSDANGEVTIDIASLGENLEPGEHSASYTYIDPSTGEEITRTYNFTVVPDSTALLADASITVTPTPLIPYGSGNPYLPPSLSPTISLTPSIALTASPATSLTASPTAVASGSAQYNSGSVGTTIILLFLGFFFVMTGAWSYFLAHQFED